MQPRLLGRTGHSDALGQTKGFHLELRRVPPTGHRLPIPLFGHGSPLQRNLLAYQAVRKTWAGSSYDNALAETINGLYKTEVIRRRGPWRGLEDVEFATLEWVDWFNNRRLLEPIGNIPPAEYEQAYYQSLEAPARVAGLN